LPLELDEKGGMGGAVTQRVEQPGRAFPAIFPARIIEDRVKTEARDRHAGLRCNWGGFGHVIQPCRTEIALASGPGNEDRPLKTAKNPCDQVTGRVEAVVAGGNRDVAGTSPGTNGFAG